MTATALKKVLFSLMILDLIIIILLLIKKPLSQLGLTVFGSLISGLVIALCIGLAEMDLHKIGDIFRRMIKKD